MKTRQQQKKEEEALVAEFTHKFFEDSSKAWLANKEKYGENMYRYKPDAFDAPLSPRKSKRLLEKNK